MRIAKGKLQLARQSEAWTLEIGILLCLLVSPDLPNVRQVSSPVGIFCLAFSTGKKPGLWNDGIYPNIQPSGSIGPVLDLSQAES